MFFPIFRSRPEGPGQPDFKELEPSDQELPPNPTGAWQGHFNLGPWGGRSLHTCHRGQRGRVTAGSLGKACPT